MSVPAPTGIVYKSSTHPKYQDEIFGAVDLPRAGPSQSDKLGGRDGSTVFLLPGKGSIDYFILFSREQTEKMTFKKRRGNV